MKVLAATSNEGKLVELRRMLAASGVEVVGLADLLVTPPEVEETEDTLEGNATKKARELALFSGLVTIGDDSGLEVDALGGAPGVRSARYSGGGPAANVEKLLRETKDVPEEELTARFRCVIALCDPRTPDDVTLFSGSCEGRVLRERRGTGGFGYDPIIAAKGEARSIAEMGDAEKDAISHRGEAVQKLARHLARERDRRAASEPVRLVTIPFSHYCEKARWALDRAGIPYVEEAHIPLVSWLFARRAGGSRRVPIVVTKDRVYPDSTDILHFADAHGHAPALFSTASPETAELEHLFDEKLGPHVRRVVYDPLLRDRGAVNRLFDRHGGAGAEGAAARALRPLITTGIRRGLKIDAAGVARSWKAIESLLEDVEARLARAPYLSGSHFGAADLTFAALFAPLVWPAEYERFSAPESELPDEAREIVARQRVRPAGQHALRVYRLHR